MTEQELRLAIFEAEHEEWLRDQEAQEEYRLWRDTYHNLEEE